MKLFLYFLVFSIMTFALFSVFLYLMTEVDPGLRELPARIMMGIEEHATLGGAFAVIYSIFLIGLFGVCCYLMSIVNPDPLPDKETDPRRHDLDDMYPSDPAAHDHFDYGMEKIPEGVDAAAYSKQLVTKVTRYDFNRFTSPYHPIQRVVPPAWPSERTTKGEHDRTNKNKTHCKARTETSSPAKGLRRSVNDKRQDKDGNPIVLLKFIDERGHKKIEIKYISKDNIKTKRLRKNRCSTKGLSNSKSTDSQSVNLENTEDKVIEIKPHDVIILSVADDSDVFLEDTTFIERNIENSELGSTLALNMSYAEVNTNDTQLNHSKVTDLEVAEKELEGAQINKEMYKLNILYNNDNKTVGSRGLHTNYSDSNILYEINDTSVTHSDTLINSVI